MHGFWREIPTKLSVPPATLAVLDALDAITSRCRRPKLRDLKSAMEEATEI